MSVGTDPEFFLIKGDKIISSIPHIDGTKDNPTILPSGGNVQRDNVAVEIATKPAETVGDFISNIRATLREAVGRLPEGTRLEAIPSAYVDKDQLDHPEAIRFGCDPDFDAWNVTQNEPPSLSISEETFRSCGAHIHVGTNGKDGNSFLLEFEGKLLTVKVMDCLHGIVSTMIDYSEAAVNRRKLYGKAGAHRPKDYGVEYRVLSNYWLKSPITVNMIYQLTLDALSIIRSGKADELIGAIGEDEVQRIINDGDRAAAEKVVVQHLFNFISAETMEAFTLAASVIKSSPDMYKEWALEGAS